MKFYKRRGGTLYIIFGFILFGIIFGLFILNPIIGFDEDGNPERIAPSLFIVLISIFGIYASVREEKISRLRGYLKSLKNKNYKGVDEFTKIGIDFEISRYDKQERD